MRHIPETNPDESGFARACAAGDAEALRRFARDYGDLLDGPYHALTRKLRSTLLSADDFAGHVARIAATDFLALDERASQSRSLRFFVARLELEDLALALSCSLGCHAAWKHLERSYGSYVKALVAAAAKTPSDGEEISSSLLGDLFLARQRTGGGGLAAYRGHARLSTWLRAIVHFKAADFYDARRRTSALASANRNGAHVHPPRNETVREGTPDGLADRRERLERLERTATQVIQSLGHEDRFLVEAYYLRGETLQEIGSARGVHKASVSRWITRVRKRLMDGFRRSLGPDAFEETDEQFWIAVGREFQLKIDRSVDETRARAAKEPPRG
ncbi:MAG: sigma-70 family RNA polymerase sigma factor [Planctomycetes bacterium]|nr:sigma-70 family RNA polymerase sigma factor [Planctomycetota bacterium]MBI3844094.1 sigma-70 family RNA polymerase sigma factor [Planctomycetota bacterium]